MASEAKNVGEGAASAGETLSVALSPEELADLDAWISTRMHRLGRAEALRELALAKARVDLDAGD